MIAVIFEVLLADKERYLDHAAHLKKVLEDVDGFVSVERFQSLADPRKLLSLSLWRDEAAVSEWRRHAAHRRAQSAGRGGIFQDYRLCVARVIRDYGMTVRREQVPADSKAVHDT